MMKRILIFTISLFFAFTLIASESSDAEKYYRDGQWAEAEQLYVKLLKKSPSNRIYNHRYGVCLLEQDKDLATAEKHLNNAEKRGIHLSSYYLGRVAFKLYKFDEATAHYSNYLNKASDKERVADVGLALEKCKQGSNMLSRTEDVQIIDRFEVDKAGFFKHYKLSKETGRFIENPEQIGEDSICHDCTIYMTERGDRTFFSANNDNGDIDLFSKNRLLDQWSEKQSLGSTINTEYDEAYPFLMSDGVVLYFSSKGHNALGGYDIFVTRYHAGQNNFLPPQQLGMPFNSPGNDLLFVIDEYSNIGWFASDREGKKDQLTIYTFVPNSTIKLLDTSDKKALRKAARITESVIDTSYEVEVELSPKPLVARKPKPEQYAISFVLNDTLTYADLSDFMSDDASRLYLDYMATDKAYDSCYAAVGELRKQYSKAIDSQEKNTLISAIIGLENKTIELEAKRDQQLQGVRRLEIETIRLNGGYLKEKPDAPTVVKEERVEVEEAHISPWESAPAKMTEKEVTQPFFFNKTLYDYYEQIFSKQAINQLVEANKQRIIGSELMLLSDYVMTEYTKPIPEEGFFEKVFAHDTTFTPRLTQNQMVDKVTAYRNEASMNFIESNQKTYFALHGQNVMLLESVQEPPVRQKMQAMLDRASFAMQEAQQNLYLSEGVLSQQPQKLARGNGLLRESIQQLEMTTLFYLQYRYEREQKAKAKKRLPDEPKFPDLNPPKEVAKESVEKKKEIVSERQEMTEKQVGEALVTVKEVAPAEEYRIQFGMFSRILKEGDVKLSDLSYVQVSGKELYKYYSGHFASQMEAAMGLEEVKAKGFKDAFVVKFVNGIPE